MTIEEIKQYLPHRYPFLLIDRVLEWEANKRIVALKNVSANEPFFQGHFPHYAVMPGVLIIEAMAQSAAMLGLLSLGQKDDGSSVYYFVGIDGARFKRPVRPGDQLVFEVEQLRLSRGMGKFKAVARVGGDVVSEAELLCALRPVAVSP
ncbi:MAG: 3-hydroxyacyl-ACP dehydratase FabZ [Betaproteobacteria bacterium]|nr:3-hydroxyacyl-ACP dehydratase FabZ [Betaproteobacteria bacterium]